VAYFPEDNTEWLSRGEPPEHRIDLLVTVTEPELTAIRSAQPAEHVGLVLAYIPPTMLAALKFAAGRPQDLADVEALLGTGKVDVEKVRYLLAVSEGEPVALRFTQWSRRRQRSVRDRDRGYVGRQALREAFGAGPRRGPR